ncbi:MAG: hypothetical protein ABFS42_07680 [Candidatus Krumholzibacteriota bacterium]
MFRSLFVSALLIVLTAPCLGGEIVQIPLDLGSPELALGEDDIRIDFDSERELPDIVGVRLHITGYYLHHRSFGWIFGDPQTYGYGNGEAGLYQGFIVGEHPECVTEYVFGNTEDGGATFDLELEFDCGGPDVDWAFLAGGAGTLLLRSLDCYLPPYPFVGHCTPSAYLESATLVIQLDSLVAVEHQSWGSIKARYR